MFYFAIKFICFDRVWFHYLTIFLFWNAESWLCVWRAMCTQLCRRVGVYAPLCNLGEARLLYNLPWCSVLLPGATALTHPGAHRFAARLVASESQLSTNFFCLCSVTKWPLSAFHLGAGDVNPLHVFVFQVLSPLSCFLRP